MTGGEVAYLIGVIIAFAVFSAMLAYCSATSGGDKLPLHDDDGS